MTKRLNIINILPLLIIMLISLSVNGDETPSQTGINYVSKVSGYLKNDEFRNAIKELNEYELHLISKYPKPSYIEGLFKCTKSGISFHSIFDNWKSLTENDLEIDRNVLLQAGLDFLFAIENPKETQQVIMLYFDLNYVGKKLFSGEELRQYITDINMLKNQSIQITSIFGAIKQQYIEKVNNYDVIIQEFSQSIGEPKTYVYIVCHKGKMFIFALKSPENEMNKLRENLQVLLKSISIEAKEPKSISFSQDIISDLNKIAEYEKRDDLNTSIYILGEIRKKAQKRLPAPVVSDTKATLSAFNISLTNPDQSKYSLDANTDISGMPMVMLAEKYSVNEEGLIVMVLDFATTYSPAFLKTVKEDNDDLKRQLLIGAGRSGAMNIGDIIQEQFIPLKGEMAYEAVVKMAAINNMKARLVIVPSKDYDFAIMIMHMNSNYSFEKKTKLYNEIIKNNLQID